MPLAATIPEDLAPLLGVLESSTRRVEEAFDAALATDLLPVQKLVEHIETYRGKMLRPQLVILSGLSAAACANGPAGSAIKPVPGQLPVAKAHITIAAVCEMIHMATLVHDDVLDDADVRRSGATVNRLKGNEAAVILGDFLFSSAYHLCSTLDSQRASLAIAETGRTLCSGELLQLHHRGNYSLDEATYFCIVEQKTGSLISTACRLGALESCGDEGVADRFAKFGMSLGVAFQIQDDLLDLTGNQAVVGKPLHRDLELGKLTLPLIHHLSVASAAQRAETLMALRVSRPLSEEEFDLVLAALQATGSIEYAAGRARGLVEDAKAALAHVPDSPARSLLLHMADQVTTRAF